MVPDVGCSNFHPNDPKTQRLEEFEYIFWCLRVFVVSPVVAHRIFEAIPEVMDLPKSDHHEDTKTRRGTKEIRVNHWCHYFTF